MNTANLPYTEIGLNQSAKFTLDWLIIISPDWLYLASPDWLYLTILTLNTANSLVKSTGET